MVSYIFSGMDDHTLGTVSLHAVSPLRQTIYAGLTYAFWKNWAYW
ncbi:hypothetical protein B4096_2772 [Heyndrickxia coagulans]|nr:hypothetical protein B4100_2967 [Heyndrickxia coagulans]KYC91817.1 hypothetical protein B4096_2772 [Heyndrickxia coagulans]